jgi:hypothetical protein
LLGARVNREHQPHAFSDLSEQLDQFG